MSFLDDLIAKSQDLLSAPIFAEAAPTEQYAVPHDSFDAMDWKLIESSVPRLQTNMTELHAKFDYVPSMFEDMFNLLHQGDPKLNDTEAMQEKYRPNREMVAGFHSLTEVESLRLSTMHDKYATAMAILSMQDKLAEAFTRMKSAQEAAAAAEEARKNAEGAGQGLAQALANAVAGAGTDDEQAAQDALAEALAAAEDAAANAQQQSQAAQTQAKLGAQQAKNAMQSAAHQAGKERAEEEQLMSSFGVDDGELKRMDFEERRRLAERLRNNRLAQFAKLIGQFRMFADAERRRKVQHKPDMVVGVELGNDLMRITSGEMTNLAVPELEDDFWRRWASHELLQYKMEGSEKLGQGPVIVVCDESGSMAAGHLAGGTREAWSKALTLALADQARRGSRDFFYIGFSSSRQQWQCEFPGGRASIEKVIEFTEHFYGGGTSYEQPLEMARKLVERYGAEGKPRPDIVFITDEEYGALSPDFLASWQRSKAAHSMRCFGVAIGCHAGRGALAQIADDTRRVDELTSDPSHVADLFRVI
jgi:uncharacterized protein with von Willebrand factor type A (vWA) domain